MAHADKNGMGIASLVLGILSIIFAVIFAPAGLVMAIIGLVFALKQRKVAPNGIATGGLVTSIIDLVLGMIFTIVWIIALYRMTHIDTVIATA